MEPITTLLEIVRDSSILDELYTIYAAEPWSPSSEAASVLDAPARGLPGVAASNGITYFIEIFLAHEFSKIGLGF